MADNGQIIKKTELQTAQQTSVVYNDAGNLEDERDILKRITSRESKDRPAMDELIKNAEENESYLYSTYLDNGSILEFESDIQVPKLFENIEALIPLTTRQTPTPNLTVLPKSKKASIKLETLLSSYLTDKWQLSELDDGLEMQPKAEENMRNVFTQRGMCYKLVQDMEYNCPVCLPVPFSDLCFPKDARNEQEASYIIHYTTSTYGELIEKFPDKEEKLREKLSASNSNISKDSIVKHIEYWENDFVAWAYEGLLLGYDKNPYYNHEDKSMNHFKKPMKPFVFETDIRHGQGMISRTTFIEMAKSVVRNLDKRKRYIDRNAQLSNGILAISGASVDKEDAPFLGRDTTKTIFLEDGEIDKAVRIITASPISNSVVEDMYHDEKHIDAITGVNDTLRGERTAQETAEGRQLLKESALGRLEVLFRMNERAAQKIYNWLIQFLFVFTPEEGQRVYGAEIETGANEVITRKMLKGTKILCYVKDGSTFPIDKMTIQTNAIERFKLGLISREDALKDLDVPDYEGMAYRKYLEDTNPALLYDPVQKQGIYDPMAIMHIYDLLKGRDVPPFKAKDLKAQEKYVNAFQSWLDGKQLDEGLPFVGDLDSEILMPIKEHITESAKILAEMIALEQSLSPDLGAAGFQPQAPVEPLPLMPEQPLEAMPSEGMSAMAPAPMM